MSTAMTVKGQVTIPKRVREAAGIRPGDRVDVEIGVGGGITIRKAVMPLNASKLAAARARIDEAIAKARAGQVRDGSTTDQLMHLLRSEP